MPVRRRGGSGGTVAPYEIAPRHDKSAVARSRNARSSNRRRLAVGPGSPLFFSNVLEHRLVQEELSDQLLKPIDLELQLTAPAISIGLGRIELLSPAVVHGLA